MDVVKQKTAKEMKEIIKRLEAKILRLEGRVEFHKGNLKTLKQCLKLIEGDAD